MKKFLPGLLLGLVLGALATWLALFRPHTVAPAAEPSATTEKTKADDAGVHLSNEQIASTGLQMASPQRVTLAPTVAAYGRVIDPVPLVAAAAEIATAQAALRASEQEFARVKSLHDEGDNASAQAVETAEAAAQRDRVQLNSARARFTAAWGSALATKLDSGLIDQAVEKGWAFARIDVPPGGPPLSASPATAQVSLLIGGGEPAAVEVIGPAPTADPQLQGRGYLVLLRDQPLPAGAALRAWLPGEGAPASFPALPRRAFVQHDGSVFVFVQTHPDTFERRRVELGRPLPDAIAVLSGVDEHDQVVVTGAQQLLSTELAGGGGGD